MRLSKYEKETIILTSEGDDTYNVYNLVFHLVFPSLTGSSKARRASQRSR